MRNLPFYAHGHSHHSIAHFWAGYCIKLLKIKPYFLTYRSCPDVLTSIVFLVMINTDAQAVAQNVKMKENSNCSAQVCALAALTVRIRRWCHASSHHEVVLHGLMLRNCEDTEQLRKMEKDYAELYQRNGYFVTG